MKTTLEIKINDILINNLDDVSKLRLTVEDKHQLIMKLLNILNHVDELPFNENISTDLNQVNNYLIRKLQSALFNLGISKMSQSLLTAKAEVLISDLILNPIPAKINVTIKNTQVTCDIYPDNIILIESNGRIKNIFLKVPIKVEGIKGLQSVIHYDNNVGGFRKLLKKIDANPYFIHQINRSIAINIKCFSFDKKDCFVIKPEFVGKVKLFNEAKDKLFQLNGEVKVEKLFDNNHYNKVLEELQYHLKKLSEYEVTESNIEKFERYKKSLLIT